MKGIRAFLAKHKVINVIVCAICVWLIMLCIDFYSVDSMGRNPICCMEMKNGSGHFVGLGYTFDIVENPASGNTEYVLYVFGQPVKDNFTN